MASHNHSVAVVPRVAALAAGLAVLALPNSARAQATYIRLTEEQVSRPDPHSDLTRRYWISRTDCIDNIEYTFPFTITLPDEDRNLEVWAGPETDCTVEQNRDPTINPDTACWFVGRFTPSGSAVELSITTQQLLARNGLEGAATCDPERIDSDGAPLDVYFMLFENSRPIEGGTTKFEMGYDLVGPSAPSNVEANAGDQLVMLTWDVPSNSDGVTIYCEELGISNQPAGTRPLAAGGAAGAAGAAATSGVGGAAGVSSEPRSGGTGGAAGAASESDESCTLGDALASGEFPSPELRQCGEAGEGESRGTARGLENGQGYAIAVAAVDELGNVGQLSSVRCIMPREVTTFFESYRGAGGKGGGGFCAFGASPTGGTAAALSVAGLVLALRRRRRR